MKKIMISGLFLMLALLVSQESDAQRRVGAQLEYSPFSWDVRAGATGGGFGFNLGTQYYRRDTYFTHVSLGTYSRQFSDINVKSNTLFLRAGRCGLVGDTEMDDNFIMYFGWYLEVGRVKYKQIDETLSDGSDFIGSGAERTALHGNIYGLNFGVEKTINQKFVIKGNFQANVLSAMPGVNLTLGAVYRLY